MTVCCNGWDCSIVFPSALSKQMNIFVRLFFVLPFLVYNQNVLIVSFETLGYSIFTVCAKIYHLNLRGELLCLLFQSKHVPEFKDLQMAAFISLDLNEGILKRRN